VKPAEIRALDDDKLDQQVENLLAEWRSLRFQQAVGQLTATARTRQIRKDIARIKTIQTEREIEAARRAVTNYLKRGGKVWIRIFPDKPVTHKPAETRMGSGKGNPEYWVAVVKPGRVLFEVAGVTRGQAEEALRRAAMKMPMDCRFIERQHVGVASTSGDAESDVAEEVVA